MRIWTTDKSTHGSIHRAAVVKHHRGHGSTAVAAGAIAVLSAVMGASPVAAGETTRMRQQNRSESSTSSSYVVQTSKSTSAEALTQRVTGGSGQVLAKYSHVVSGFRAELTPSEAARLAAEPGVESVTADFAMHAASVQSNPTWGLDRIDQRTTTGDGTYNYDTTGAGVTVFVVDSGIRMTHSQFGGRAESGWDFVDNDADATDCYGHGTHVAATVGGSTYGVAKNVKLVALRVFDCNGGGSFSTFIEALDWAVAHKPAGPSVISFSGSGVVYGPADDAVQRAVAAGIPVVLAAGNDGGDACNVSPGRVPAALTVGSVDSDDVRAPTSDFGSCVDVFAPGVDILSATIGSDSSSTFMSGTSSAAPHVTGIVARYLQNNPSATPAQVSASVVESSTTGVVVDAQGSPNRLAYLAPSTAAASVTAPSAANSVIASKNDSSRSATLNWTPPTSDGGSPITGYTVSRDGIDNAGNGAWSTTLPATARSQIFTNLKAGNTYRLTVRAVTAAGPGPAVTKTVTIAALAGAATSVSVTNTATRKVTLSWGVPATDGGSPITGYKVSRNGVDNAGAGPWSTTVSATARSQAFTNLKLNTTYTFTVQAITSAGLGPAVTRTIKVVR
jgi:subtilisin family serine protease